jgi:hypothetical protein
MRGGTLVARLAVDVGAASQCLLDGGFVAGGDGVEQRMSASDYATNDGMRRILLKNSPKNIAARSGTIGRARIKLSVSTVAMNRNVRGTRFSLFPEKHRLTTPQAARCASFGTKGQSERGRNRGIASKGKASSLKSRVTCFLAFLAVAIRFDPARLFGESQLQRMVQLFLRIRFGDYR